MGQETKKANWIFRGLLVFGFFVLIGRLGELQIVKGEYFKNLSQNNRIRKVPIVARRGEIHARGGEIIAESIEVRRGLRFSPEHGFEKFSDPQGNVETVLEYSRKYKLGKSAGHLTGYIAEARQDEVGKTNPGCSDKGVYKLGSLIGRTGLEEQYECVLRGVEGEELFEVDSQGNLIRKLGTLASKPGENIITNIDFGLQEKLADAFGESIGAGIISDTRGEILAIYSSPSFDPNLFVQRKPDLSKLFTNPEKPLFNRVLSGTYHPGSVFKPFVGIAALEEDKIGDDFTYQDTGKVVINSGSQEFSYANWYFTQYGGVEGTIGLKKALARSTDTFFYKVGEILGVDNISKWAGKFGFEKNTGVDLPGEVSGLVPTPKWKKETRGENWFLGNTYHYAIGQGDLAVTPLSINMATSALVSGNLCRPMVVGNSECTNLNIRDENRNAVLEGMYLACSSGGTAVPFFDWNTEDSGQKVACKTGTAETGKKDTTHAWFTVIAPYIPKDYNTDSTIVMTILVEEGGEGSKVAAPIAREVLEYFFNKSLE